MREIPIPTKPKSAKRSTNGDDVMKFTMVVIHVTELVTMSPMSDNSAPMVTDMVSPFIFKGNAHQGFKSRINVLIRIATRARPNRYSIASH